MKTAELRKTFLDFFQNKQHTIVPSSSLIPEDDPSLLFTNAGMVQFKNLFLGREKSKYTRAVSVQKCMRVSGKHNDLEQVGYTARHHTFFEMLGNFSFGDYFKREAIQYAWEFLTAILKLPPEKLWVTVYQDDTEAEDIWLKEIGVNPHRFARCGKKDNFWAMGDTGPCGPCSEIFYDHGAKFSGGPPGSVDEEGDRYVEIWNLVFMQYDRGNDGKLTPLPKPSIDTGMGLERLATVMQGVHSNYDIDIFKDLIAAIAQLIGVDDFTNPSLKVIADHIRASAFLIADGIVPANEGRGYVLRRIVRRAIRHGNKLGVNRLFFYQLVAPLVAIMGDAYPELSQTQHIIEKVLFAEEEQFAKTLQQGLKILEENIAAISGKIIPGELVFTLYDTYGFPADLTADIARERGLLVDDAGFAQAMQQQRTRSQAAGSFQADAKIDMLQINQVSEFSGYANLCDTAEVKALLLNNQLVEIFNEHDEGYVVLDKTPFYAESGGQIGDKGEISGATGLFAVQNTQKKGDVIIHFGNLSKGVLHVGDKVQAKVDAKNRRAISLNHTATHLLHAALRRVLGKHVKQRGSLVETDRLRFDFSHFKPMTVEEIHEVNELVYAQILANYPVETEIMTPQAAIDAGAMALFGEKYGDSARVLRMSGFSLELCGGTHAQRTGDLGYFRIILETGVAAGVRRIEAVTGWAVDHYVQAQENHYRAAKEQYRQQKNELEKTILQLQSKLANSKQDNLIAAAKDIGGVKVLAACVQDIAVKDLRILVDLLKDKLKQAVILLATVKNGNNVSLVAGVTKNCLDRFQANELVKIVAEHIGGKGGGRPDMAQGGGNKPDLLPKALVLVEKWVEKRLECATGKIFQET
jgi:alanyl-tRNA synthetase